MSDYSNLDDDALAGKIIKLRREMPPKHKRDDKKLKQLDPMVHEYVARGEKSELLFVHGTLLSEPVQREIWGETIVGTPATLEGYESVSLASGEITVDTNTDKNVKGKFYRITSRQLMRSDQYEGEGTRRVHARVKSEASDILYTVWVHVAKPTPTGIVASGR